MRHAHRPTPAPETLLRKLAAERILVLDGAMGTMIQAMKLDEEGYRGARFDAWNREVRGNNDLLEPEPARRHPRNPLAYYKRRRRHRLDQHVLVDRRSRRPTTACRTSPTSSTARARGWRARRRTRPRSEDGRPRFVAGALGPTNRTASISPDVANPGYRAVTFDELRQAYGEQVRGLLDGGADLLLIETIFDTLNAKAAIYAIAEQCEARGVDVPVMISGTITDRSGRLLSGQTPEAFWNSVRHAAPVSVGLNCALGAEQMRAHIAEHGAGLRHADLRLSERRPAERVRPLPRKPARTWRGISASSPTTGLVNIVGGCCGTTPEHIARDRRGGARQGAARSVPELDAAPAAVGPRAVHARAGNPVRQRRRAHQRHRLGQVPQADHGRRLRRGARDRARAGRERRADHRRQHGRGPARFGRGDEDLPQSDRGRARHRPRAGDGRFLEILGDRGRPEVHPGQAGGELDLAQGGRGRIHQARADRAPLRRGGGGDGVRRAGPGRHRRAQGRDLRARLRHPGRTRSASRREDIIFDPNIFAVATGIEEHNGYGVAFIEARAPDPQATCRTSTSRAACRTCRSRSAATSACARRCTRCSSITPSRPAWTWASSTPARWRSTTTSIRSCARPARTWCSTAGRTRPSGCWRIAQTIPRRRARSTRRPISPGANGRWRSGCRMRSSTASPTSSSRTPRRRGKPPTGRCR